MLISFVDTETTGFEDTDSLIELAIVTGDFSGEELVMAEAVSVLLPCLENKAKDINGIDPTLHAFCSKTTLVDSLNILGGSDFIVAHNAEFDKKFVNSWIKGRMGAYPADVFRDRYERILNKGWICTLEDYKLDKPGRKLLHMAADHGVYFTGEKHRALADTLLLFETVKKIGKAKFLEAVENSRKQRVRVVASVPMSRNGELKEQKFRWDPERRQWWKEVRVSSLDEVATLFKFPVSITPSAPVPKRAPAEPAPNSVWGEVLEEAAREKAMGGGF